VIERLSDEAEALFASAQRVARRHVHAHVAAAHVLLAALEPLADDVAAALASTRVAVDDLRRALELAVANSPTGGGETLSLDEALPPLLQAAGRAAALRGDDCVRVPDLLAALLGDVNAALQRAGIDGAALARALEARPTSAAGGDAIARYTVDLTERARAGKLDPVIGREPEIRQVIQVLSRRLKNNPLLVGEPGVGKTAVVEGLAQRIAAGHVPEALFDHAVLSLDLGLLLAGTRYRGQFEERLKALLSEIAGARAILFIDEIHTVVGAGGSEGGTDAANLLKPALSRGELRCIGATTVAEHRKRIEKDPALSRRFQLVTVDEPTPEQALTILRGLKAVFEAHHGVRIADSALQAAVQLGTRYLTERHLPDKAIDLIDQAAATLRTALASRPEALETLHDEVIRLEIEAQAVDDEAVRVRLTERRERLQAESALWLRDRETILHAERARAALEDARRRMKDAVRDRRYPEVAQLQYHTIPALEARQQAATPAERPALQPVVGEPEVAAVVARTTGIPAERLTADEGRRLLDLDRILGARVIGQPHAVERVARAVRRARAGLGDPRRPLASFLLVGPTGVGKTELCKALAEFLFADERALVRLDMSEYMEKHTAARLVGAPPGYVGFDEGGELTNRIRRRPYSVVLLDEVEKAHPDVFNLLLQVLDEGHLTDSSGRRVDFKNTVIMLTSNLGGRGPRENVMAAVKAHFRPELLNRLDDTLLFAPLGRETVEPIVRLQLSSLTRLLAEQRVRLQVSDAAVARLAEEGYDPEYGARPLKRLIQNKVQDPLADAVLSGALSAGGLATVDVEAGALAVHAG
jgi:ATP-dependent Clp protease ATP-binding subunit ClpB